MLHRVGRELLILYVVVTVPWAAWCGYLILDAVQRHPSSPVWRYVSGPLWSLLILSIGGFLVYLVLAGVIAGFRTQTGEISSQLKRPSHRSMPDYYSVIGRAVSKLPDNTSEARETLYDHARTALAAQLHGRDDRSYIASERFALEAAILRVEADASPNDSAPSVS